MAFAAEIHGLEAIYAIETIDLSSIRPLQIKKFSEEPSSTLHSVEINVPQQFSFDFGAHWNETVPSFLLLEPIEVLQIPGRPLQLLKESGKWLLGDLLSMDLHSLVFIKGMGQGHIDEIQQKLAAYVKGKSLTASPQIGLGSWVRSLLAGCCHKQSHALLSAYQLQHLIKLSAAETVELRNLSGQKRRSWENEAAQFLVRTASSRFSEQLEMVSNALIKPWIVRRGGVASELELVERFGMVADCEDHVLPVLALFADTFCLGQFLFARHLSAVDAGLFAADDSFADIYASIISRAHSYFLQPDTVYTLDALCQLLCRDFSRQWCECSMDLIAMALRRSSSFLVRKHIEWGLIVKVA
jgi:hypothetical protein